MRLRLSLLQCGLAAAISIVFLANVLYSATITLAHAADDICRTFENRDGLVFGYGVPELQWPGPSNSPNARYDLVETLGTRNLNDLRRATRIGTSLGNNQFQQGSIQIGETQWWYFPREEVNKKKSNITSGLPAAARPGKPALQTSAPRDYQRNSKRSSAVYISLTTCLRPAAASTLVAGDFAEPPQLEVYISMSKSLEETGPGTDDSAQTVYTAHKGYVGISLDADDDVFIAVSAPNATGYLGKYQYQIAASIDALFHSVNEDGPFLLLLDSDASAALLVTDNLTQSRPGSENYRQWMDITPPYTMFAYRVNDTALAGLERSYCAFERHSYVKHVGASMTNRGLGNKPKAQFYMTGLNSSTFYYGILARDGNGTSSGNGVVGGGGKIWKQMNFTTKSENNCAVLFDLPFCSEVAYAVPSNPNITIADLGKIYDTNAASLYQNFSYSLQQIQCNTTAESMYSLAVNCSSCERAYKEWLCAVTIPRCADFSNNAGYLQPRNAGQEFLNGSSISSGSPLRQLPASNYSRNPLIDTVIRPGPYKEILTCEDICYTLVKNCPAALGFSCPKGPQRDWSYGTRDRNGVVTCNYLGAAYFLNEAVVRHRAGIALYILVLFWPFVFLWRFI